MVSVSFDEKLQANAQFVHSYGQAMLQWSYIEDRLFTWFRRLTDLPEDMARAIFFSARSFNGRLDMLNAVIAEREQDGTLSGDDLRIIKEISTKAATYAGVRNAVAHGVAIMFSSLEPVLVQGKHKRHEHAKEGISNERLIVIGRNFQTFSELIMIALRTYSSGGSPPIRECLEQVRMLPNESDSTEPSQKQLARQRQRKLVRRSPKPTPE